MTVVAEKNPSRRTRRLSARNIPPTLIYEMWQGKPVYYRGYQEVLAGKKTAVEIRGRSDIQSVLVSLVGAYLGNTLNRHAFLFSIGSNFCLSRGNIFNSDLLLFEKEKLANLKGRYFDVAPKIVIEVDIKADMSDFPNKADEYIMRKSQKLLDFGVEKVLWIITSAQKVYVIDRNDPTWYVVNWSENIAVLDNCVLNIKQLLDDEEIAY